jgi:UDP-glucose 4-epimerase
MSRILITGGFGFVGGRLARRLAQDHEVWVSSRKEPSDDMLRLHGNPRRIDHSILLDPETFPAFMDTVIHLAALNELDSVKQPAAAIRVNVEETQTILTNSITKGVKQFIYFSTAHIYGSPLQGHITEETLPIPIHPYAITHRAAEDYVVAATRQKKIRGIVLRLSNSFGAPVSAHVNRWTLLTNDLCRQAVEQGKLTLKSSGCQFRDFICLSDVEEVIFKMVASKDYLPHIIYNLGSGASIRVIDMALEIAVSCIPLLHKNVPVEVPEVNLPINEPDLHFSINRLLDDGFVIQNDAKNELSRLLSFCIENFSHR